MTFPSSLVALLSVVAISGWSRAQSATEGAAPPAVAPVAVAAAKTPLADGSPHFSRVLERLDVGGKTLQFEDHEGRRETCIALAATLIEAVPKNLLGGKYIDAAELVDACGFGLAAASGSSLRKDGDFWLWRGYTYLPGKNRDLAGLLGAGPVEFRSPGRLPATTDLALEVRLDASSVPGLIQRVAKACGQAAAAGKLLDEPMPIGKTLQGLLSKTNLHLILGMDISALRIASNEPAPVDFILQLEGGNDLLPDLLGQLEQGLGKPRAFGERQGWELPTGGLPYLRPKPLLLYNPQGVLTLVSREAYLQRVDDTARPKLAGAKEFLTATAHFPKAGNLLVFSSSRIPPAVAWAIRQQAAGKLDRDTEPLLATITQQIQALPWSLCVACEADGIATTSELPFPIDSAMTSVVPLLTMNSTLFIGARAWKKGSDRAGCILNIRNVQQAIRAHQNMNVLKEGDPIPWDEIFGEKGYLKKPSCPGGGTYTFLTKMPKVGELACKCSIHDHEPPNHEQW